MFDSIYAFARGLHHFNKNPLGQQSHHNHNYNHHQQPQHSLPLDHHIDSGPSSSEDKKNQQFGSPPYSYDAIAVPGPPQEAIVSSIFGNIFGGQSSSSSSSNSHQSSSPLSSLASCSNDKKFVAF